MIRGPRRGLGTFRCTAALSFWILMMMILVTTSSAAASTTSRRIRPAVAEQQRSSVEESSISNTSILRLMSKNNLYIQSFPNGTISATGHDTGFYSVLRRGSTDVGKMFIQGVVSKQYICINHCGLLYGSDTLHEECILREQIESNWYNTYTSIKHSKPDESLLMAFGTNGGSPCRLRMKSRWVNDSYSGGSKIELALGIKEKYAVFLPVTNISLPEGMNLTSLALLNKRVTFMKNSNKSLGCPKLCLKSHHHHHNKKTKTNPSKKKNKEGSSTKRPNPSKKNNKEASSSSSSSSSTKRPKNTKLKCSCLSANETERCKRHCREQDQRRISNKSSRPSPSPLVLEEWRLQPTPTRKNSNRHPHKKKKHHPHSNNHPPRENPDELRPEGDNRLIRHMYRKIRAHPELEEQLLLASGMKA